MRPFMSTVIDGQDMLGHNIMAQQHQPHTHTNDTDIHDLDMPQFPNTIGGNIPASINGHHGVYYSGYPDNSSNSFSDNLHLGYAYPLQDGHLAEASLPDGHLDFQYILGNDMSHPQHNLYANEHAHMDPKHYHQSHEMSPPGPSSEYDPHFQSSPSSSSSLSYTSVVHDLSCSPDNGSRISSFTPASPPKITGHAHTMLPPIVHRNASDSQRTEKDNRSQNKRVNTDSAPQTDPYAAAFLREQLGEDKYNTFSARLFERRLGAAKSRCRGKGKSSGHESAGATAIDFLVKVEIVKEVLRTYVPHPYNPLKSLTHPYSPSPSGSVTLMRSTVLVLSGWSNTQFSYWARRAEGISVLSPHDERLRAVALALERRLKDGASVGEPSTGGGVSPDQQKIRSIGDSGPTVTGKGLDIIIEEVKKSTGLSPFLRGKHSSLDPFGSTNSDKDTGPGPPPTVCPAPVYMPTFQATEYLHSPPVHSDPPPRRPKKRRRISVAESLTSLDSLATNEGHESKFDMCQPAGYAVSETRTTPDAEDSLSCNLQAAPSPNFITVGSFMSAQLATNETGGYELEGDGLAKGGTQNSREYFPVSDSRSDLDDQRAKRPRGVNLDAHPRFKLSV
ncbi:hypothetical protein BJ138DRAFT_1142646 [Hygrophoropsis aurantiaca]|uniref:Uncharacterized protein n=1 Tax=Hygrophoropsis aurantiaca TaxID=72124 RepID=A0ACB8APN0_9AGAM|nr:hypothetical protein BJ138DRAFT_1142646 [Hygrophoropsis aurantiaca]